MFSPESLLSRSVSFIHENGKAVMKLRNGKWIFVDLNQNGKTRFDYSSTEDVELTLCCPNHCMLMLSEASKISTVKHLVFRVSEKKCSQAQLCLHWLCSYLDKHKAVLRTLEVFLSDAAFEALNSFQGMFSDLDQLTSLKVARISTPRHYRLPKASQLNLSVLANFSTNVKNIVLEGGNAIHRLNNFAECPWEQFISVHISCFVVSHDHFKEMLKRLTKCESLYVFAVELEGQKMSLFDFINMPVCKQLKKLVIHADFLFDYETNFLWDAADRLPELEFLEFWKDQLLPEMMISICSESRDLRTVLIHCVEVDVTGWDSLEVVELDVIKRVESLLQVLPQIHDFRILLPLDDSNTDFCNEFKEMERLKNLTMIKELCPNLKRFRFTFPGNFIEQTIDLKVSLCVQESCRTLKDTWIRHLNARNSMQKVTRVKRQREDN
jgi:hypothetical protein